MPTHFERMLQLVNEVFDVKNDPTQLNVDEDVIERLQKIHPDSLSDYIEGDGPVVWILLIPTLTSVMNRFLSGAITEQQILDETPLGGGYDAIYLCSASVLEEFRHKGLATSVALQAIENIRKENPVRTLFYWPFSREGELLAASIAKKTGLSLLKRS